MGDALSVPFVVSWFTGIINYRFLTNQIACTISVILLNAKYTVIYTVYIADSPAANETHTLWFLIFVKSTRGSVAVCVVD